MLEAKLPDITEFSRTYLGVDPVTELVPVYPTCHYVMGGIPTTVVGEVLRDNTHVVPGLYAAGECACVSVHGANRLGTNSLLDINVFGRRAGLAAAYYALGNPHIDMPSDPARMVIDWVAEILSEDGSERVADIRSELQQSMDNNAAVFRTEETLNRALTDIHALKDRYSQISVHDKGQAVQQRPPGSDRVGISAGTGGGDGDKRVEPQRNPAAATPERITQNATMPISCATPWRTRKATI